MNNEPGEPGLSLSCPSVWPLGISLKSQIPDSLRAGDGAGGGVGICDPQSSRRYSGEAR